jgi:hypothetical protein
LATFLPIYYSICSFAPLFPSPLPSKRMGAFCTVNYGVGGVFYRLVSSSNSQVSYQLIWKLTLLLFCLLLTATTTSTTAKKERRYDVTSNIINGFIHGVASGLLVDVDLHTQYYILHYKSYHQKSSSTYYRPQIRDNFDVEYYCRKFSIKYYRSQFNIISYKFVSFNSSKGSHDVCSQIHHNLSILPNIRSS